MSGLEFLAYAVGIAILWKVGLLKLVWNIVLALVLTVGGLVAVAVIFAVAWLDDLRHRWRRRRKRKAWMNSR